MAATAKGSPLRPGPSSASSFLSIRNKQIACLERMLNFNNAVDSRTSWQEQWKILIYDAFCRDIISTLFKVADLRRHGVTLHLNLHADRQPVQDASALYLFLPSSENIDRIAKDCAAGLYDSVHLNCASSIPQSEMHDLATAVVQSESAHRIAKVVDQYMNFVSLSHSLFSLNIPDSFFAFNDPQVSDSGMDSLIDQVVKGLFGVVATLGVVPLIRFPPGNAAAEVGERLYKRLQSHLQAPSNLFSESPTAGGGPASSSHRPLLIILDRAIDLSSNLQHAWTYEAMLHDVLGMSLNKVTVADDSEGGGTGRAKPSKVYDLGVTDTFWLDNMGKPFPSVTDEIEVQLNAWKSEYDRIGASGTVQDFADKGGGIEALTKAAQLVPELTERKRVLDMHTNICTVLLSQIKERELDNFFSLESAILSGSVYNAKSALMEVFSMQALGTAEDKLRLFLIFYLNAPNISEQDLSEYENALSQLGADLTLMQFLKYLRKMKQLETRAMGMGGGGGQGGGMGLGEIMSKVKKGTVTATGLLKTAAASIAGKKEMPVTRTVEKLMDNAQNSPENDSFAFLDPTLPEQAASSRPRQSQKPFREAIVFTVGSGNCVEAQDLQELAQRSPGGRNIIYGSTELVTASEFLRQLTALGGRRFAL